MSAETIYKINNRIDWARERSANTTEEFKCKLIVAACALGLYGAILIDGIFF